MSRRFLLNEYATVLAEIKERVRSAQYAALRAVNKELVGLYWDIGRMICERQSGESSWVKSVVARLSADLRAEFPGVPGFSDQNLWYMRQFYLAYHSHPKLQPLVGEISWDKHLVVMARCTDDEEPNGGRVRTAERPQTDRRRHLPYRQTPAARTQRSTPRPGRDR